MPDTKFTLAEGMHLHLVGIGGAGMSSIARVLLERGFVVSGSDQQESKQTNILQREGATVFITHQAANIHGAEAVVISSAIPTDNPEVVAARAAGIPILKRADFLGMLMAGQVGIAVAGSHGKTTTTAMIAKILMDAGQDPTVILGGMLPEWDSNGRAGLGDYFVIEADEYDHMFLGLRPDIAVITNIEHDHPDIFPTSLDYREAFRQFAQLLPADGRLIACAQDEGVQYLLQDLDLGKAELTTYGLGEAQEAAGQDFDFVAVDPRPNQLGGTDFILQNGRQTIGIIRLRVPGLHNVLNALAAIIIGLDLEVDFGLICRSLADFGGVGRRFQVVGEVGGVTLIDDYAHHPTEIRATLAAARQRYGSRRLWAVWQPHTYSRTKMLLDQFATSFTEADRVVALDIFRSRETDTLGINTAKVIQSMAGVDAVHIATIQEAVDYLLDRVRPDDVILTLGAGDSNLVAHGLLDALKVRVQTFRP
jgi:UDP-N-acetylmuramate--alanine ligase